MLAEWCPSLSLSFFRAQVATVRYVAFSWHRTKSLADWRDGMMGMTGRDFDDGAESGTCTGHGDFQRKSSVLGKSPTVLGLDVNLGIALFLL